MLWKKFFALLFVITTSWLSSPDKNLVINDKINQLDNSFVLIASSTIKQNKITQRPNFENLEETLKRNPLSDDSLNFSKKSKNEEEKFTKKSSIFSKIYWKREQLKWNTKLNSNPKKIESKKKENYIDIQPIKLQDQTFTKKKTAQFYKQWYSEMDRSPKEMKPENLRSESQLLVYESDLAQYYKFSWKNVSKYGLTLKELENTLIIIAFIRFCIYTVKYDIKTSFIICSIGLVSALFYIIPLTDCIAICYHRLFTNTSLFRFMFEEYIERETTLRNPPSLINLSLASKLDSFMVTICPNWILNKLYKSSSYWSTVDFITESLIPDTLQYMKSIKNEFKSLLLYSVVLRMGKRFVPYHIQWHVMFYVLYGTVGHPYWKWYVNSREFLQNILIPEQRYEEIELMKILHCFYLGIAVYLILLAMLHALFSQYFYIPLYVPNIEAHIGKRPKNNIYSGGYTSWQDEIELFRWRPENLKLWFGFLGKSLKDRKRKRKDRRD